MTETADRLQIDVHLNDGGVLDSLAADIHRGLTSTPKQISPKYFYDEVGSELFEQITALPEYYPYRAERQLLSDIAGTLMETLQPAELVELGSGSSAKTRLLLGASSAPRHLKRYVPFDVSESIVRASAAELLHEYPFLRVHGVIGDFERHLPLVPAGEGRRLVLFLGGTIGNLNPGPRVSFLEKTVPLLGPEDRLLVGMDLVKDKAVIEAAYNDEAGVTAAFNLNVLTMLNRTLGADFDTSAFAHRAFFNEDHSRIEMHLVARWRQTVHIAALDLTLSLDEGESIWTENSYKFTRETIGESLEEAGLRLDHFYTNDNPDQLFGVALAAPA